MRAAVVLALLGLGCNDSGPIVHSDGGASDALADATSARDVFVPDGGCRSDDDCGDRGSSYVRCITFVCAECASDSDCTNDALGPTCVGSGEGAHCICGSDDECAANVHGPVCRGVPGFCGCTGPGDCPSGSCVFDSYVAGDVCAP